MRELPADLATDGEMIDRAVAIEFTQLGPEAIWLQTLIALDESASDYSLQAVVGSAWKRARRNRPLSLRGVLRLLRGEPKAVWRVWMACPDMPDKLNQLLRDLRQALRSVR